MSPTDINPMVRVAHLANRQGDRLAVVDDTRELTYAALFDETRDLVLRLAGLGVGRGGKVSYLGLNSIEFVTTFLACSWLGAVFVPFNFRLSAPELRVLIEDCGIDVMIAEPAHAALLDRELTGVEIGPLLLTEPAAADVTLLEDWKPVADVPRPIMPEPAMALITDDDLGVLMYTSGTTGRPKGVRLTHGNLFWNQVNVDSVIDTRADDVNLAMAPLFHVGALNSFTLRTLARGGTNVIRRGFSPAGALADIERYGVTSFFAAPTMFAQIAREPAFATADLSGLRAVVVAAAPVPPSVIETWMTRDVPLQQAWGLTETAPFATWVPVERVMEKLGSAGLPMPFTEVAVFDLETREIVEGPNVNGELAARGPNVVSGYWNNPSADAAAFTPDGWFLTGDIGYTDDEGYVYIVDRLKDMVITGGENVYPAEVERVLAEHPDLTDNAVVGMPDEKWGETVVSVVSRAGDAVPTLEDVREFCSARLARYKLPTRLVVVDAVPRNGSGKLDKVLIRRMLAERFAADAVDPASADAGTPDAVAP